MCRSWATSAVSQSIRLSRRLSKKLSKRIFEEEAPLIAFCCVWGTEISLAVPTSCGGCRFQGRGAEEVNPQVPSARAPGAAAPGRRPLWLEMDAFERRCRDSWVRSDACGVVIVIVPKACCSSPCVAVWSEVGGGGCARGIFPAAMHHCGAAKAPRHAQASSLLDRGGLPIRRPFRRGGRCSDVS
jgi:hypothetical protein